MDMVIYNSGMAETHHCEDCQKLNTEVRLYRFGPVFWNPENLISTKSPQGFSVTNPAIGWEGTEMVEVCRPCLDKRITYFWDSF
jgi:hypothetical protein